MKRNVSVRLICISILFATVNLLCAQGTAFTYQGQLDEGGSPASGSYDFTFALYNTSNLSITNVAGPITNSAVVVTNGLFTTTLDFGSGIFTGTNYWLGIAVRTNGGTQFTGLSPRQPLLPVPYAIFATTASNLSGTLPSSQLSGALPSSQISGTYSSAVTFSNSANSFIGVFTGNFTGTGSSLSNLNASQLTTGTVADARLSSNVALLNTNQTFTGFNTFTGTNNLTGVNIFTNMGNNFHGSFFGNGLVGWIPTNATALQAVSDTGYLLTSPGLVTVTLPPTPNVSDIVRISGAGAGGWLVKENTGQFIYGNFASYRNSVLGTLPIYGSSSTGFSDVAASADGTQMYAVGTAIVGVYASADSGQTWNPVGGLSGFLVFRRLFREWEDCLCSVQRRRHHSDVQQLWGDLDRFDLQRNGGKFHRLHGRWQQGVHREYCLFRQRHVSGGIIRRFDITFDQQRRKLQHQRHRPDHRLELRGRLQRLHQARGRQKRRPALRLGQRRRDLDAAHDRERKSGLVRRVDVARRQQDRRDDR